MSAQTPPLLPIVAVKAIEEGLTWEKYEKDPLLLFQDFASLFAVQGNTVNDNIIKSDKKPLASDRGKLWVKTSWPYAIVSLIDGEYKADYGISGLVPNTPFLHAEFAPAKDYIRILDATELTDYGITDTKQDASQRMRWHIFEPPAITI